MQKARSIGGAEYHEAMVLTARIADFGIYGLLHLVAVAKRSSSTISSVCLNHHRYYIVISLVAVQCCYY